MFFNTDNQILNLATSNIGKINGINEDDYPIINKLFKLWRQKYPRNMLRSAYYDARNRFRDLRVAIPPQIASQAVSTIGWAEKSVRALADKSVFEGFISLIVMITVLVRLLRIISLMLMYLN